MNIAFERKQFLDYIWEYLKLYLPPTHHIKTKNFKTMSSYYKSLNFLSEYSRLGHIKTLEKNFSKYVFSFGEWLKNNKSIEKVLIFNIINRENIKKKDNYDDIEQIVQWSRKVNKIIKASLDKIFLGAETVYINEFKNADAKNKYLSEKKFTYQKLK